MKLYSILTITLLIIGCRADPDSENVALLTTDKKWSAAIDEGNVDEIVSYWADNAIVYFPERTPVLGKEAIFDMVKANRQIPGFALTTNPAEVTVSSSGDLGYTMGTFVLTLSDKRKRGHYVNIWKKQANGLWKCVVEISSYLPAVKTETEF